MAIQFQNNYPAMGYPQQYGQPYNPVPAQQFIPAQRPQNTNIIWVQGEAAGKSYLVSPNTELALWDSENQTIYLKQTDIYGKPIMYKVLDYTIREEVAPEQMKPLEPNPNYVTKEDFNAFAEKLQQQISQLANNSNNNRNFNNNRKFNKNENKEG